MNRCLPRFGRVPEVSRPESTRPIFRDSRTNMNPPMDVVIFGASHVGVRLAERLGEQPGQVLVIDPVPAIAGVARGWIRCAATSLSRRHWAGAGGLRRHGRGQAEHPHCARDPTGEPPGPDYDHSDAEPARREADPAPRDIAFLNPPEQAACAAAGAAVSRRPPSTSAGRGAGSSESPAQAQRVALVPALVDEHHRGDGRVGTEPAVDRG